MADIEAKFAPMWVVLKITERDESGQPRKGVVLCKHLTRQLLSHELNNVSEKDICIFQAMGERAGFTVMV